MNIQEAKDQIKYAISAYLSKNEQNDYIIPISAQRPLFIMGAPGIGKTDIMKQVAEELNIGMVSYSMTHHTRQSALGLPFIQEKQYKNETYQVTEYTMSEILSNVYDIISETGTEEGILFLDEINCVSETLAPSMLQFLQFKTFGRHKVPDGWVVVTAGNPSEYNKSVREFDVATWDRLKRVDVDPDFNVWSAHAKVLGVHPAILSYLEVKQYDFYKIETTVDGKTFVTARGWVDLSQMMRIFEEKNYPVDETLISQYLQNREVAKNFAIYYDLFKKYRSDYEINSILDGTCSAAIIERGREAPFDEQIALISLLSEALTTNMSKVSHMEQWGLNFAKDAISLRNAKSIEDIKAHIKSLETDLSKKRQAGSISKEKLSVQQEVIRCYDNMLLSFLDEKTEFSVEKYSKQFYLDHKKLLKRSSRRSQNKLENTLNFAEKAFENSQAFFLLMTELTATPSSAQFLSKYGGDTYFKYNKDLLIDDNRNQILEELKDIEEKLDEAFGDDT